MEIDKIAKKLDLYSFPEVGVREIKIEDYHLTHESSERPGIYRCDNNLHHYDLYREDFAFDDKELVDKIKDSLYYFSGCENDGYVLRYDSSKTMEIAPAYFRKNEWTDKVDMHYDLTNGDYVFDKKPKTVTFFQAESHNDVNIYCPTKEDLFNEAVKSNRYGMSLEKDSTAIFGFIISGVLIAALALAAILGTIKGI